LKREIIITADGSATLHVPELNEHYHSTFGAVQESKHVFIENGFLQINQQVISVFELGFGTGLNCFLTLLASSGKVIHYTAIEPYPVENEIIRQLNYSRVLNSNLFFEQYFEELHSSNWNEAIKINPQFTLKKINLAIEQFNTPELFDLVYFDAFAPAVNPHLWTKAVLQKMYDILAPNGVFVTYCAKGEVRRNLQSCGFRVQRIPGPPGKREILRGIKD
jgi:tRNA U34 5-methylaminomethyl-2-thiouridine-forming methyltransferase MnmC